MSNLRKLVLLALTACALFAISASSSAAVTVVQESTGTTCGTASETANGVITQSGACPVRGEANDLELGGIFGAMVVCDVHLEGFATGTGFAVGSYSIESCENSNAVACTGSDQHSDLRITSDAGTPWSAEANFCTVAFGITIRCHVNGTVTETGHIYQLNFVHTTKCEQSSANSLQGSLTLVSDAQHPAIEIK